VIGQLAIVPEAVRWHPVVVDRSAIERASPLRWPSMSGAFMLNSLTPAHGHSPQRDAPLRSLVR
jgi:hypothetical protein